MNSGYASDVLTIHNPLLKVRPLSEATRESKHKAYRLSEFLQPPKPRTSYASCSGSSSCVRCLGFEGPGLKRTTKTREGKVTRSQRKEKKSCQTTCGHLGRESRLD
ncbi:coiled-coil domain-containing protein R3HCC1L-like [Tachypleus tridentatus]|uniref:coiled-coil domain-containing protein R3HCC1L-like n=1 Tax=Tachypleus tridentatus TaxID=6853 RepID=UPI003FD19079